MSLARQLALVSLVLGLYFNPKGWNICSTLAAGSYASANAYSWVTGWVTAWALSCFSHRRFCLESWWKWKVALAKSTAASKLQHRVADQSLALDQCNVLLLHCIRKQWLCNLVDLTAMCVENLPHQRRNSKMFWTELDGSTQSIHRW